MQHVPIRRGPFHTLWQGWQPANVRSAARDPWLRPHDRGVS
jgi:hypothetical protein